MVTERQINNAVLGMRIKEIFNAHKRRYGAEGNLYCGHLSRGY